MITDDALRQHAYQFILKAANRRMEQAIPGSAEGAFAHLSQAALLNLFFLMCGEWGSIGDFVTTRGLLEQPSVMIRYGLIHTGRRVPPLNQSSRARI